MAIERQAGRWVINLPPRRLRDYIEKLNKGVSEGTAGSAKGFKEVSELFGVYTDPSAPPSDLADARNTFEIMRNKMSGDRDTANPSSFAGAGRGTSPSITSAKSRVATCKANGTAKWSTLSPT